jgi:muconolactone delta-isomerase
MRETLSPAELHELLTSLPLYAFMEIEVTVSVRCSVDHRRKRHDRVPRSRFNFSKRWLF